MIFFRNDKTLFTKAFRLYMSFKKIQYLITKNPIDYLIWIVTSLPIGYLYLYINAYITSVTGISFITFLLPLFYLCYFYQIFKLSVAITKTRSRNFLLFLGIKIFNSYFARYYGTVELLCELGGYCILITEIYLRFITNVPKKVEKEIPGQRSETLQNKLYVQPDVYSFRSMLSLNPDLSKELDANFVILALAMVFMRALAVCLFALFYYIPLFNQIMDFCHLPLLEPLKTCYVNGVFDLGHYNHMKLFDSAKKFTSAHRLIVGVMSDEDVKKYKGDSRPIDPADERVKFVQSFPAVTEVIKDAPWSDVPADLIQEYNIDCVAHSAEYSETAEDYAYRTPRNMGIVTLIPRGEGASTSKRIDAILKLKTDL